MMGKASFPFRLCLLLQRFPLYFRTCHAADLIACGRIFFQNFFPIFPFKTCKQRNRRIAPANAVGFFQLRIEAQHDVHIILPDHSANDRSEQTRRVYKANVDCGLRRSIILLFLFFIAAPSLKLPDPARHAVSSDHHRRPGRTWQTGQTADAAKPQPSIELRILFFSDCQSFFLRCRPSFPSISRWIVEIAIIIELLR